MKTTTRGALAALTTILSLAGSAPLAATQGDGGPDEPSAREAERLEEEAAALASFPHRWNEVVDLYRKAADVRPEGDPKALWDLRQAGRIAYYVGREETAVRILRRAGDTALAFGDVVSAANLFLDAAWVAHRRGDAPTVQTLKERARRLARSPLLDGADGTALRQRLAPEAVGGGL